MSDNKTEDAVDTELKDAENLEEELKLRLNCVFIVGALLLFIYGLSYYVRHAAEWQDGTKILSIIREALQRLSPERLGQLGDYIGGFLNPFIAFFALIAIFKTTKVQVATLHRQLYEEKSRNDESDRKQKAKDEERLLQDDFNRKFDSYKDVVNQISSQMLYPWAKNEPAISGKAALSRYLEIICSEEINRSQGGNQRESMLLVSCFLNYYFVDGFGIEPRNRNVLFVIRDIDNKVKIKSYLDSVEMVNAVLEHIGTGKVPPQTINNDSNDVIIRVFDMNIAQREPSAERIVFFGIENWRDNLNPFFNIVTKNDALMTYFRAVFQVLNSQAEGKKLNRELFIKNVQFFKSQLTQAELTYIGIYILFANEGRPLLHLVKQFALLEYLPKFPIVKGKSNLGYIIFNEPDCGEECFKEIE